MNSSGFTLADGDKFALICIENACARIDPETQLADGTWVWDKVPIALSSMWRLWIGSVRADSLAESNVVLARKANSQNHTEQEELAEYLQEIFSVLQLSGVMKYDAACLLIGSFRAVAQIREIVPLTKIYNTKGYTQRILEMARLEAACRLRPSYRHVTSSTNQCVRPKRGFEVLFSGLAQRQWEARIHQFARSLDALILPEIGKTKKQFVHRCQTFAKRSSASAEALRQAYDLRRCTEHMIGCEKYLRSYPPREREKVALWRTQQLEALACFAYSHILQNDKLLPHFTDDVSQEEFWKKIDEGSRIKIWGTQLDLDSIPLAGSDSPPAERILRQPPGGPQGAK